MGLLEGPEILLETKYESTILCDHLIYDRRQGKKTPVERYLDKLPMTTNMEEHLVREAMARHRLSVLQIQQSHPGAGVVVLDLLRDEPLFMVDEALSRCAPRGGLIVSRLLPLPDYWMGSGALFPISPEAAELLQDAVRPALELAEHDLQALPPRTWEDLTAVIIGTGFMEGSTAWVEYR